MKSFIILLLLNDQDTFDILLNLNLNKANRPDEICHRMLKETSRTICVPLTVNFNRYIQENIYQDFWKDCYVILLFKKGDKNIVSNYRTISLISVCKVMERVVVKYTYNYLHANKLIYHINQHVSYFAI